MLRGAMHTYGALAQHLGGVNDDAAGHLVAAKGDDTVVWRAAVAVVVDTVEANLRLSRAARAALGALLQTRETADPA